MINRFSRVNFPKKKKDILLIGIPLNKIGQNKKIKKFYKKGLTFLENSI